MAALVPRQKQDQVPGLPAQLEEVSLTMLASEAERERGAKAERFGWPKRTEIPEPLAAAGGRPPGPRACSARARAGCAVRTPRVSSHTHAPARPQSHRLSVAKATGGEPEGEAATLPAGGQSKCPGQVGDKGSAAPGTPPHPGHLEPRVPGPCTVSLPPNTAGAAQPRSQCGKPREICSTPLKPSAPRDLAPSSSGDGQPRWAPLS